MKKLDGSPLHTESTINKIKHTHRYKRLFASDLLKNNKQPKNIEYTIKRANQLNKIENLAVDKPIPIVKPKAINTITKPIEEPIIRKSTRERKPKKDNDYI